MSIDTSVQTFTDTELLNLWRLAYAKISVGQSYSMNGRMMTYANLSEVQKQIEWLEARVDIALGNDGNALAQFGEAV